MLQRWLGTWAPYIQELKINFTGHKNRITKSCLLSNTKKPNWEKDAGPRAACDWIILGERGSRRARNASWKEVEYEHFLYSLSNFFQCILCVVPGNGYMVEKREKSVSMPHTFWCILHSYILHNKKTEWTPTWWNMAKRWTRDRLCLDSKSVKRVAILLQETENH